MKLSMKIINDKGNINFLMFLFISIVVLSVAKMLSFLSSLMQVNSLHAIYLIIINILLVTMYFAFYLYFSTKELLIIFSKVTIRCPIFVLKCEVAVFLLSLRDKFTINIRENKLFVMRC